MLLITSGYGRTSTDPHNQQNIFFFARRKANFSSNEGEVGFANVPIVAMHKLECTSAKVEQLASTRAISALTNA